MAKKGNVQRAKALVDQMDLIEGERARLKRAIERADDPDEWGWISRYLYDGNHHREITAQIQDLLRS